MSQAKGVPRGAGQFAGGRPSDRQGRVVDLIFPGRAHLVQDRLLLVHLLQGHPLGQAGPDFHRVVVAHRALGIGPDVDLTGVRREQLRHRVWGSGYAKEGNVTVGSIS